MEKKPEEQILEELKDINQTSNFAGMNALNNNINKSSSIIFDIVKSLSCASIITECLAQQCQAFFICPGIAEVGVA